MTLVFENRQPKKQRLDSDQIPEVILAFLFALFSVLFHVLMVYEAVSHSWITGFYWTLTTMSTLGFGDIFTVI